MFSSWRDHISVTGFKYLVRLALFDLYGRALENIEKLFSRVVVSRHRRVWWDYHVGDYDFKPVGDGDRGTQDLI